MCCYVDGILLLEVNRLLRAGGYFVWAAQPVYKHEPLLEEQWQGNLASLLLECFIKVLNVYMEITIPSRLSVILAQLVLLDYDHVEYAVCLQDRKTNALINMNLRHCDTTNF